MSLVPDYEDSDGTSQNSTDSQEAEDENDEHDDGRQQQQHEMLNKNDHKKESLPSANFLLSGTSKPGAVFNNPFKAAENAKLASLEKHVKMVSTDEHVKTINGKKICWNYRKGRCRFGSKCKFAHDSDIQMTSTAIERISNYESTSVDGLADTPLPTNGTVTAFMAGGDAELDIKKKRKKRPGLNTCIIPSKQIIKIYSGQM